MRHLLAKSAMPLAERVRAVYEADPLPFERRGNMVVVFPGVNSDWAGRQGIPGLSLYMQDGELPRICGIVGTGRKPLELEVMRAKYLKLIPRRWNEAHHGTPPDSTLTQFGNAFRYYALRDHSPPNVLHFREFLQQQPWVSPDEPLHVLFVLCVPPAGMEEWAKSIAQYFTPQALALNGGEVFVWLEKPTGTDAESATRIHSTLKAVLPDTHIEWVNHHIARFSVQNLRVMLATNPIIAATLAPGNLRRVTVLMEESEPPDAERSANYLDPTMRAAKDMAPHLFELAAIAGVEVPALWTPDKDAYGDAVAECIGGMQWDEVRFGQYGAGVIKGKPVPACITLPGASPEAETAFTAFGKYTTGPHAGVEVACLTGKGFPHKHTSIQFDLVGGSRIRVVLHEESDGLERRGLLRWKTEQLQAGSGRLVEQHHMIDFVQSGGGAFRFPYSELLRWFGGRNLGCFSTRQAVCASWNQLGRLMERKGSSLPEIYPAGGISLLEWGGLR